MDGHAAQAGCTGELSDDCDDRHRSTAAEVISAVPPQFFNPTATSWLEVRAVVCSPQHLQLHPALDELAWSGGIAEFNEAARLTNLSHRGKRDI